MIQLFLNLLFSKNKFKINKSIFCMINDLQRKISKLEYKKTN